jgi:AcrR family transcriptional regulator
LAAENPTHSVPEGATLLRNEPVQARSTARLASLLDAAAAVVDEIGYERLTTALVAERAGASIGTVYRYFPDRIVVLQGLSARFLRERIERTQQTLLDPTRTTWQDAIDGTFDDLVEAFRTVPGFRSLRFGDVLDLKPDPSSRSGSAMFAAVVAAALSSRYGLPDDYDLAVRTTVVVDIIDALLSRAFSINAHEDDRYVQEARTICLDYLAGFYGDAESA